MRRKRQMIPIDWQVICITLQNRYKPLQKIAPEVGADPQTLQNLARGSVAEPRYTVGHRLLTIYNDITGQTPPGDFTT